MSLGQTILRGRRSTHAALMLGLSAALVQYAPARAEVLQHELLLFEEPVVTTAAKHAQTPADAPASVSIITQDEIRRFGYRTLAEAMRSLAGFYSSYDRNYTNIGVRGFLRPGDYNDRILLLVNGHTYNSDVYQQAPLGPEFGIDMEDIERIEVVRGPGSALYGGNALFAVINVITATAVTRPGVQLLAQAGSFDSVRGQASVGHVFANGLEVFAEGSAYYSDGPDELFFPAFDAPETNNGIARHADGEQAYNFFFNARYGDFSLQGAANQRVKQIPTGSFGTTFNDNDTQTEDGRYFAELAYAAAVGADIDLLARLYYDGFRYHGTYIFGSGDERVENIDTADSHWFGGELRGRRELFAGNALTLGVEGSYHPDASQGNFNRGGEVFLDDSQSFNQWGVYLQDEWTVHPTLTLVGGLRYDSYYDRISKWSPRVAAVWHPIVPTTLKLLYGQAFRPPNLFEQYYAYMAEGVDNLPNPRLDSEQITTYEAVLEQDIWHSIHGTLDVYHWDVNGLIDQVETGGSDAAPVTIQYQNSGAARATGMEVELRAPLPGDVLARTSYSFQDARAAGGARLTNSPCHLATAEVRFPLPWRVEAGAELLVVGPRETRDGGTVSTATTANLTLGRRRLLGAWLPGLDGYAGFYNIFDQHYDDPAPGEVTQDRIEQDGFTFRVQLRYAFQP